MTSRRQMSEQEKLYVFAFLFPPLWPLGLAMLIGDAVESLRAHWRQRRDND